MRFVLVGGAAAGFAVLLAFLASRSRAGNAPRQDGPSIPAYAEPMVSSADAGAATPTVTLLNPSASPSAPPGAPPSPAPPPPSVTDAVKAVVAPPSDGPAIVGVTPPPAVPSTSQDLAADGSPGTDYSKGLLRGYGRLVTTGKNFRGEQTYEANKLFGLLNYTTGRGKWDYQGSTFGPPPTAEEWAKFDAARRGL